MNGQVAAGLCHRHPALPDQLDRLDLELAAELPVSSSPTSGFMKHLISVSIKPAAAQSACRVCVLGSTSYTATAVVLFSETGSIK